MYSLLKKDKIFDLLLPIFYLMPFTLYSQQIGIIKSNMTINFSCQSNYLKIGTDKYFNNETAFVCNESIDYSFYDIVLSSFHADGSPFPVTTTWKANEVPIGNGATIGLTSIPFEPYELNNPKITAEYTDATNIIVSVTVFINFTAKRFEENLSQVYGYDPNSDVEHYYPSYSNLYAWKSLQNGVGDVVNVSMLPFGLENYISFHSLNDPNVSITPTQNFNNPQQLTVTANGVFESTIISRFGENEPCGPNKLYKSQKIASYDLASKDVSFIIIAEANDDEQTIEVGKGLKNTKAITAGPDGFLNSIPLGDDIIVVDCILTGEDGICQSIAQLDDEQLVGIGKGVSYQPCVEPGVNFFRDTPNVLGDDEIVNDLYINTGLNGICETTASTSPLNFQLSQGVDVNTAFSAMNQIYKQAIFQWEAEITPIPNPVVEYVNYDRNRDGKLQIGLSGVPSEEFDILLTGCNACNSVPGSHNVILLDFALSDEIIPGQTGNVKGVRYQDKAFAFFGNCASVDTFFDTISHELGHAAFELKHPFQEHYGLLEQGLDAENLMEYGNQTNRKLRKYQWD